MGEGGINLAISLIQALYDSQAQLPVDEEFYKDTIEDIQYFDISSQVYYLLKQQGKIEKTPTFFQEKLKEKYTKALYQNLFIKNQTELLLNQFEQLGIEVIPLKGTRFAERYFGHVGARWTSDIDLLIKPNDLDKATHCIQNLGFSADPKDIPSNFNLSFNKELPHSPIPLMVELHWSLLDERTTNFNIKEIWNQAVLVEDYKCVKELSDHHTFYMITLHGWRHNMDSLKYFIDIIQLIHFLRGKMDYSALFRKAAEDKTLKRMVRTLSIVYKQFPHLEAVISLPKKTTVFWKYETFRYRQQRSIIKYIDFVDYQFLSYDSVRDRLVEIVRWILSSNSYVVAELGVNSVQKPFLFNYFRLVRKRCIGFIRSVLRFN
jgi:hypothetical protein